MDWIPWVSSAVIGAFIGWATNLIAIKMLFHPRKRILGVQGLLPRRQRELARDVGQVIATELVHVPDLLVGLDEVDLEPHLSVLLDKGIAAKIGELRKLPLVGSLISDDLVRGLRNALLKEMLAAQPQIIAEIKAAVTRRIDIAEVAATKLASFDLDRLEGVVKQVARNEFRAIEWYGAVLGAVIGLAQPAVSLISARLSH
ncbi:MAG: DUF445 family protein [Planctomycetes bacterium]|nr:DUF445 family protein [Planctomycetota bacterium]